MGEQMNLKNQPPILVHPAYRVEIESLSKAALMDIVWSFATRCAGREDEPIYPMNEIRRERDAVLAIRKAAKGD